jgi:ankyrin repeat protein
MHFATHISAGLLFSAIVVLMSPSAWAGKIHDAVRAGDIMRVKTILAPDPKSIVLQKDEFGLTPLQVAAAEGHDDIVTFLLSAGADKDVATRDGLTALHCAAFRGQVKVVQHLLAVGAHRDVLDNRGFTPLHHAAIGHFILKTSNAGVTRFQELPNIHVTKALLDQGSDAFVASEEGVTALHLAASNNNAAVVEALLAVRVTVSSATSEGWTPLHYASMRSTRLARREGGVEIYEYYQNFDSAQLLINAGASVNAADKKGVTALMVASQSGSEKVVKLLLAARANIGDLDNQGEGALHYAAKGSVHIEDHFRARGPNELSYRYTENSFVIQELLKAGADPNAKNSSGQMPIDLARRSLPDNVRVLETGSYGEVGPNGERLVPVKLLTIRSNDSVAVATQTQTPCGP